MTKLGTLSFVGVAPSRRSGTAPARDPRAEIVRSMINMPRYQRQRVGEHLAAYARLRGDYPQAQR